MPGILAGLHSSVGRHQLYIVMGINRPYCIDSALQMIFSWEDFLTGHSPKEHELDGSDSFMLFPMPWCFGWTSELPVLCCDGATGVGRAAGQLCRTRWEVARRAFLVFDCWQIPYHVGYPWRDVSMMEDCPVELNFHISVTVVLKKTSKKLDTSWD